MAAGAYAGVGCHIPYLINYSLTIYVMYSYFRHIKTAFMGLAVTALSVSALTSCDVIYEDMDPCPEGAELRFVYEYNLEFYNTFPAQVTCLTVLVYDAQGNYIKTLTETSDVLSDENWRMKIDLPAGQYTFIAYGGMACDDASFQFSPSPGGGVPMTDVNVELRPGIVTPTSSKLIHPLFYGALDLEVLAENTTYTHGTVKLMKDTNDLRILLHNADGSDVDVNDFRFTLTDNNTLFSFDNQLLPSPQVTYLPWYTENIGGTEPNAEADGDDADGDRIPSFAAAEISTSRFVTSSSAKLVIEQISTERTVLSIPLVKYLLLYKSNNDKRFKEMGPQEFLDRKSQWEMTLFLDPTPWGSVTIYIEDWRVRINDITA